MNWKQITVSNDNTHFLFEGKPVFNKHFIEVLKFHVPGLAPVKDETGAYHIDSDGNPLSQKRYVRTFGFYCNRAAVVQGNKWLHITEQGERAYSQNYAWAGNYQENLCTVRDLNKHYFHIDLNGNKVYSENYLYCGDFKCGIACVKHSTGLFRHIDAKGKFINDKEFLDLGVFHKNFATAKDKDGWFHIDKTGKAIYAHRFLAIEPFYNGFALVTLFDEQKIIIGEGGHKALEI
ncbi:hypothetical protein EZS27_012970 [termite gut metagenome]|uniref:WG repeat-containing protein n=1 Tax=termite gut metagenome TaxID=433724 RepID=A0A5J4RYS2_9ZZZZ